MKSYLIEENALPKNKAHHETLFSYVHFCFSDSLFFPAGLWPEYIRLCDRDNQ